MDVQRNSIHTLAAALPKQLGDWHEGRAAVRMLVAALGAYVLTSVIHLPGPYSAVITTLIVARPHSGGVLRASLERLLATLLGAGIACIATFGRALHIPEVWLIAAALAPLALIVAHNSGYRTAMIAAMIVLSAPAARGSPLHVAAVRMLGVSLGAVVGALVSVTVLPSRREVVVGRRVARVLESFATLLRNAIHPNNADTAHRPDQLQMHADIVFLKRELQAEEAVPDAAVVALKGFAGAFESAVGGIVAVARGTGTLTNRALDEPRSGRPARALAARALSGSAPNESARGPPAGSARGAPGAPTGSAPADLARSAPAAPTGFAPADLAPGAPAAPTGSAPADLAPAPAEPTSELRPLREACRQAAEALREQCPRSEGARLMLRRLTEDLVALRRSVERALL